jgi:hypothetical protein
MGIPVKFILAPSILAAFWSISFCAKIDTLWQRCPNYPVDLMYDEWNMIKTSDNNFAIIAGRIGIYLFKVDTAGNVLWEQTYNGNHELDGPCSGGGDSRPFDLVETNDHGFAIAGAINGKMCLLRADSIGGLKWYKRYGIERPECCGNAYLKWSLAHSILRTQDNGFVLAGEDDTSNGFGRRGFIVRTDANGNDIKDVIIDSLNGINCFLKMPGGNYLASAGTSLLKLDTNFNLIWKKQVVPSTNLDFQSYIRFLNLHDQNKLIIIEPAEIDTFNSFFAEADTNGTVLRSGAICGNNLLKSAYGYSLAANGDILLCGEIPYGIATAIRLKYTDLSLVWRWTLPRNPWPGIDLAPIPHTICQLSDSTYYLTGAEQSYLWLAEIGPTTSAGIINMQQGPPRAIDFNKNRSANLFDLRGRYVGVTSSNLARNKYMANGCYINASNKPVRILKSY